MFLFEVVTPAEIEEMFSLPAGSVRRDISRGKFRKAEIRKSGSTWLITKREAIRVYKGEFTFIPVMDDWEWVSMHVDEELENEILYDDVLRYMQKYNIELGRVKELYHDGLEQGMEDGKYLPFSQWFYEFAYDDISEMLKEERIKEIFYKYYNADTDWSAAADMFVAWSVDNNFETESFKDFVDWIDGDELNRIWDFFFGYGDDFKKFADDWVDENEVEDYLNYCNENY